MSRFCVIAGTKISLNDGTTLPIEKIKAGQEIISFNLNTLQKSQNNEILLTLSTDTFDGIIQKDLVKNIWKNTVEEYYSINDKLKITGEHIVLAKRDKTFYWTTVDKLLIGDYLFTEQNIFEKIDMIILIKEKVKVYNLQVNDVYNYFANSYLIHNGTPCGTSCGACGNLGRVQMVQTVTYGGAGYPYLTTGWHTTTPMQANAYIGLFGTSTPAKISSSSPTNTVQGTGFRVYINSTSWVPLQHQHGNNVPAFTSDVPSNPPCGDPWGFFDDCNYPSIPASGACSPPAKPTGRGIVSTNPPASPPSYQGADYKVGDLVTVDIGDVTPTCPGCSVPEACPQSNFNIIESYSPSHKWHAKHIVLKVISVS
jgi:hypothetical protein